MYTIKGSAGWPRICGRGGGTVTEWNTSVSLAGVELKNPVMVASGTFGSGEEYSEFVI